MWGPAACSPNQYELHLLRDKGQVTHPPLTSTHPLHPLLLHSFPPLTYFHPLSPSLTLFVNPSPSTHLLHYPFFPLTSNHYHLNHCSSSTHLHPRPPLFSIFLYPLTHSLFLPLHLQLQSFLLILHLMSPIPPTTSISFSPSPTFSSFDLFSYVFFHSSLVLIYFLHLIHIIHPLH